MPTVEGLRRPTIISVPRCNKVAVSERTSSHSSHNPVTVQRRQPQTQVCSTQSSARARKCEEAGRSPLNSNCHSTSLRFSKLPQGTRHRANLWLRSTAISRCGCHQQSASKCVSDGESFVCTSLTELLGALRLLSLADFMLIETPTSICHR